MLSKRITSLQHPFVKKIVKIRKEKDFREEEKQVFVFGKKLILEIAKISSPDILFYVNDTPPLDINAQTIRITPEIMNKISGLQTQENVAALFPIPDKKKINTEQSILTIDEVANPGNLGTLFRSALALNFNAIILLKNTVDPFNDKAIRASKGSCFFLPFCYMGKKEFMKLLEEKQITPYVADMQGVDVKKANIKKPFTLILSNEARGKGIWPDTFINVSIPMNENAESLNVAVCGSILMYIMKNG